MVLPHSVGAESTLNHSVSFLWLLSLFSDDHVLKVCCLVSLSFLVGLFLVLCSFFFLGFLGLLSFCRFY